jgi:hypothetical protein
MCTYIHVKRPPFKAHTNNWSLQRARNAGGCTGKKRACGARSLIRRTSRKLKALQLPFLITRKKVQARCCVPQNVLLTLIVQLADAISQILLCRV